MAEGPALEANRCQRSANLLNQRRQLHVRRRPALRSFHGRAWLCVVRKPKTSPAADAPQRHQEVRLAHPQRLALSPFDLRMVAARITLLCASLYGASAWMLAVPGSRARQSAAVSRLPVAPQMSNDGLSAEFQARAAPAWAMRVLGMG